MSKRAKTGKKTTPTRKTASRSSGRIPQAESIKQRLESVYGGLNTFDLNEYRSVGELSERLIDEISDIEAALAVLEDYDIDGDIFAAA